jgi:hypothetical protein
MAKNKAFSVVQICKNLSGTTLSDLGLMQHMLAMGVQYEKSTDL